MTCAWCKGLIPADARADSVYCCKSHRQAAWRFARQIGARERADRPMRFKYADPPYPGLSARYYGEHRDYAGEVDHRELLLQLQDCDGWALSTSAHPGLRLVLGLCDELGIADVRVGVWLRGARHVRSAWPLSAWEPVVYAGGRQVVDASSAGRIDALVAGVRARTTDPERVVGAKPAAFADWLFSLLGARVGDTLDDLFPGSGGIARAWELVSRHGRADASPPGGDDTSPTPRGHASTGPRGHASGEYSDDGSPRGDVSRRTTYATPEASAGWPDRGGTADCVRRARAAGLRVGVVGDDGVVGWGPVVRGSGA